MILANIYIKRLNKNNRYLVYADESGTVGINDSENFVIAAIILHEEKWFEADKLISNLKREFFPRDAPEIHMSEIVNRNNAFKSMDEEKRAEFIKKIFEIVNQTEMRIVYSVIKKEKLFANTIIRKWAYKFLFEIICYQLENINLSKEKKQYGLLILDSISKNSDKDIWNGITELLRDGSGYEQNKFLIEGPVFVESHLRPPMQ